MSDNTVPTPKLIHRLTNIGNIKIWSLLVTIFGDLTYENHNSLSGAQLNSLFQAMDIKPEALRVALHRLRKVGWITSTKIGRTSHYKISETGLAETKKVWHKIYAPNNGITTKWHIAIFANSNSKPNYEAIKLSNNCYIIDKTKALKIEDTLVFPLADAHLPNWARDKLNLDGMEALATELLKVCTQIDLNSIDTSSIENTALRVLILHHWRRIALRNASWVHMTHFKNGQVVKCHNAVHKLLSITSKSVAINS